MEGQSSQSGTGSGRYIAGLDGLRAVAVMMVVLFHSRTADWVNGGFLGVDVFFVLSGF